jgi:hypothetical protein
VTAKHAAYLLLVKANQPTLHRQLRRLPWQQVPVADHTHDRGHGRAESRRLQVTTVAGLDFPHATQAIRLTRRIRPLRPPNPRTSGRHDQRHLTKTEPNGQTGCWRWSPHLRIGPSRPGGGPWDGRPIL